MLLRKLSFPGVNLGGTSFLGLHLALRVSLALGALWPHEIAQSSLLSLPFWQLVNLLASDTPSVPRATVARQKGHDAHRGL